MCALSFAIAFVRWLRVRATLAHVEGRSQVASKEEKLKGLEERRDKLNARIARDRARLGQDERRRDTRKKILAGAFLLQRVEQGEWSKERFMEGMDAFLTNDRDRELFGLESVEEGRSEGESEERG